MSFAAPSMGALPGVRSCSPAASVTLPQSTQSAVPDSCCASAGDGSLLVVRDQQVVFQTAQTVWGFNLPYMLYGGAAASAQRTMCHATPGNDSIGQSLPPGRSGRVTRPT